VHTLLRLLLPWQRAIKSSTNTSMYCKSVATEGRDGSRRKGVVVEDLEGWALALDWLVVGWVGLSLC